MTPATAGASCRWRFNLSTAGRRQPDRRPVSARIVAGLQQHRSQHHVIFDDAEDTERWQRIVTREWYVFAWPRSEHAVGLNDIFEGLP